MLRTNDGLTLHSTTPAGVVRELHKSSYSPADNDSDFMEQVAARVMLLSGQRVRTDNAEHFVADLTELQMLLEVTAEDEEPCDV